MVLYPLHKKNINENYHFSSNIQKLNHPESWRRFTVLLVSYCLNFSGSNLAYYYRLAQALKHSFSIQDYELFWPRNNNGSNQLLYDELISKQKRERLFLGDPSSNITLSKYQICLLEQMINALVWEKW